MYELLTLALFQPHLNEVFWLDLDGQGKLEMTLTAVTFLSSRPAPTNLPEGILHREESFSLEFRGPRELALPQRMFQLSHETLGELPLIFLVPIRMDGNGRYYEAVFN